MGSAPLQRIIRRVVYAARPTTRFHSRNGRLIDPAGLFFLPFAAITRFWARVTGRRPELPYISFRAIRWMRRTIRQDWKVLEFGSGSSTIWLAKRCALLVSIETSQAWYERIAGRVAEVAIGRVDYRLRPAGEAHHVDDYDDNSFDLVIVDGPNRNLAIETALLKARRGGFIYLDNVDLPVPGNQLAFQSALRAVGREAVVRLFVDFTPARLYVTEGVLFRKP